MNIFPGNMWQRGADMQSSQIHGGSITQLTILPNWCHFLVVTLKKIKLHF